MRVVKEYDERRKELLDTAERLFNEKGYNKTTVNDIREAVDVAKGTFYHYFKSKEEVLDAVIDRIIDKDIEKAERILADETLNPIEKLYHMLLSQQPEAGGLKKEITKSIHEPANTEFHMKSIVKSVERLSPVITKAILQGIETGHFTTAYPREVMDMLLVSAHMLFDKGMFAWEPAEGEKRLAALQHVMELTLGAPKGSFDFMNRIL